MTLLVKESLGVVLRDYYSDTNQFLYRKGQIVSYLYYPIIGECGVHYDNTDSPVDWIPRELIQDLNN